MTREEVLKIAKPILFNAEMVRAIQDGRKTVTRRVVKPQPYKGSKLLTENLLPETVEAGVGNVIAFSDGTATSSKYKTGDILYVRETFFEYKGHYHYKADGKHAALDKLVCGSFFKWQPSIHMPKEAARIFLRVTNVRVERLQDIKIADVVSEGASEICQECFEDYGNGFQCCVGEIDECGIYDDTMSYWITLWNSTVKKSDREKYGWAANPWVWVIEFERII